MKRFLGLSLIITTGITVFLSIRDTTPLVFFRSQVGLILTITAFCLLACLLYSSKISRAISSLQRQIFSPLIDEEKRTKRMLTYRLVAAEKKMDATEEALGRFAMAISEYAGHLSSHTGAIRGLNEASHELQKGAAEQNRVLMRFTGNMDRPEAHRESPSWKIDAPLPRPEEPATVMPAARPAHKIPEDTRFPPGCARHRFASTPRSTTAEPEYAASHQEPAEEKPVARLVIPVTVRKTPEKENPHSRQALVSEALAAEKEILGAINHLNHRLLESSY